MAIELRERIKREFIPSLEDVTIDGERCGPPRPLPWYPDEFGWHTPASRALLKKSSAFAKFHQFIVAETLVVSVGWPLPSLLDIVLTSYLFSSCPTVRGTSLARRQSV